MARKPVFAKAGMMSPSLLRTAILAAITMTAFALNSVFGRIALSANAIDPASYTTVRLVSGALMLFLLVSLRGGFGKAPRNRASLAKTGISALALFSYAAFFSFAYLSLNTGTGALILFACVQGVMIGWGLFTGERPDLPAWAGMAMALGGFVYLVSPGLTAPDFLGASLMAVAGISWGVYSLKGRGESEPLLATARNFIWSVPVTLALSAVFIGSADAEISGIALAVASGALTSALGYALWYETLKGLTATKAAIVQLTVPLIAAFGGIAILSEPLTVRFVLASALILGGVALVILSKEEKRPPSPR